MEQFRHRESCVGWFGTTQALAAVASCVALVGCASVLETADIGRETTEVPGVAFLLPEQELIWSGNPAGQPGRMLLPNDTALPGENFLLTMRHGGFGSPLAAGDVLALAGPLPAPFEYTIARDLLPLPGGAYSYAARSPAADVTCVLVAGSGIPGSAILMRNCVRGDLARALEPLTAAPI